MSTVTMTVKFRVRTRAARAWVWLMRAAQYVIGRDRAADWAIRGARRLIRVDLIRA